MAAVEKWAALAPSQLPYTTVADLDPAQIKSRQQGQELQELQPQLQLQPPLQLQPASLQIHFQFRYHGRGTLKCTMVKRSSRGSSANLVKIAFLSK